LQRIPDTIVVLVMLYTQLCMASNAGLGISTLSLQADVIASIKREQDLKRNLNSVRIIHTHQGSQGNSPWDDVPCRSAAVAAATENEDATLSDDMPWTIAAIAAVNENEDAAFDDVAPQATPVEEETLAMTEEDAKIHAKEGHTTRAIEDITTTKAGSTANPEEVEHKGENSPKGEELAEEAVIPTKEDTAAMEDIQEEDAVFMEEDHYKGSEDDQICTEEDCYSLFQHPCDLECLTLVKDTADEKVVVAEEYEDNDGLDDEEDDGPDVDNISLSVLIYMYV